MVWRLTTLLIAMLSASLGLAQNSPWRDVPTNFNPSPISHVRLTRRQLASVRAAIARGPNLGMWDCDGHSWLEDLSFSRIQIAPQPILLVQAGGCAIGGTGGGGPMWLVDRYRAHPHVIASPDTNFDGWLYSVQSQKHHGLNDLVLGWHMSAFEAGLTYFEFNGVNYTAVSSATLESDEGGSSKIIPSSKPSK